MILILIINLNYIFNIVYNVKSNEQFLIFPRTTWTRPDPNRQYLQVFWPDRGSTRPECNSEIEPK